MSLRRVDRLFDIIRILRAASQPVTAAAIADELEVSVRTLYRDVGTLQTRRIPVEGAAGVGYVLRRGYELPPLMFTEDEGDAIAVGRRPARPHRRPAKGSQERPFKGNARGSRSAARLSDYSASLCLEERRTGSCTARLAVDDPPRDPRYAQATEAAGD